MKINIQVEVDWIEEDGNIDDEIQRQIITGVKQAISKDCLRQVEEKTQKAIDDGMQSAINLMQSKVSNFFEDWLNTEAIITDKYGDKVKGGSLKDIIKREFNDCLNVKVDSSGNPSTSYGAKYTRLEYVTGKRVKEVVGDYLTNYGNEISAKVKALVEEGIKERVSDKFAEMVIGYAKQDYKDSKAIPHKP